MKEGQDSGGYAHDSLRSLSCEGKKIRQHKPATVIAARPLKGVWRTGKGASLVAGRLFIQINDIVLRVKNRAEAEKEFGVGLVVLSCGVLGNVGVNAAVSV